MLREQLPGYSNSKKTKIIIEQNHYQLQRIIGQGTFGKVYQKAIDRRTNQKVAIKEVYQDKRFKNRELQIISRLDNDNIIFMKDYYFVNRKQDKFLYIVMDFYENSLQGFLKQHRKNKIIIQPNIRKIIAFQLFKALYYLRSNNVCHRDLKPPNILIDSLTYQIKICDFGSAKIIDKSQKNVAYICSRYYRAPQLLFQYSFYRTQIDVWSAGCILVQLMTKQPIFPGDSTIQQIIQIIKIIGSPSSKYLQKYSPQISEELTLPQIPPAGWQKVLKKYHPQAQLIDLIQNILTYNIQTRLTPFDILKHKYFHDLSSHKYEKQAQKLPHLFDFNRLKTPRNSIQIQQLQQLYMESYRYSKINKKQNQNQKLETNDSTPQQLLELSINIQHKKKIVIKREMNT